VVLFLSNQIHHFLVIFQILHSHLIYLINNFRKLLQLFLVGWCSSWNLSEGSEPVSAMMSRIHSLFEGLHPLLSFQFGNHLCWHHANVCDHPEIMVSWRTTTVECTAVKDHEVASLDVYLDVVAKWLAINVLLWYAISLDTSLHVFFLEVLQKVDMRLWYANKSSSISSCICQCHDSLITP